MKSNIFKLLAIVVPLLGLGGYFYVNKQNNIADHAEVIEIDPQSLPNDEKYTINNISTKNVEASINLDIIPEKRKLLPSLADLNSIYSFDLKDKSEFIPYIKDNLKNNLENPWDEEPLIRIHEALMECRGVPRTKEKLNEQIAYYDNLIMEAGGSNGRILKEQESLLQNYDICQEATKLAPKSTYEYLLEAAELGNPLAAVKLARTHNPDEYIKYSKEEKILYKEKIGKLLQSARSNCEYTAFLLYAKGHGEGGLWIDTTGEPKELRAYANHYAMGIFLAQKTSEPKNILISHSKQQNMIAEKYNMTDSQIEEAKNYALNLYQNFCNQ